MVNVATGQGHRIDADAADDTASRVQRAWQALDAVLDPEVPVVSVRDLGIVRDVQVVDGVVVVALTPTYSGCPATELIEANVRDALETAGVGPVAIRLQRSPAWTTDWISAEGRRKLHRYGIAPPGEISATRGVAIGFIGRRQQAPLECPRCASTNTERLSAFGSTACKALHRCRACGEPFEHFKPI